MACVLLAGAPAGAAELLATASTFGLGREVPRNSEELTDFSLYEILALEGNDLGVSGF